MKKELQNKLFNKYPKIFRQKDLPMTETCMCWGIECGDGWYDILDRLCQRIQDYVDKTGCPQVEATQVKEKFGTLRFYTQGGDETTESFIDEAEEETEHICELCGSKEDIQPTKGWIHYLCPKCRNESDMI